MSEQAGEMKLERLLADALRPVEPPKSLAMTSRSSSRPSTTRSVSCGCAGGSTASSAAVGRRALSR